RGNFCGVLAQSLSQTPDGQPLLDQSFCLLPFLNFLFQFAGLLLNRDKLLCSKKVSEVLQRFHVGPCRQRRLPTSFSRQLQELTDKLGGFCRFLARLDWN